MPHLDSGQLAAASPDTPPSHAVSVADEEDCGDESPPPATTPTLSNAGQPREGSVTATLSHGGQPVVTTASGRTTSGGLLRQSLTRVPQAGNFLLGSVGDAVDAVGDALGDAGARLARHGSVMQDMAEELIRDIWQPLPRSLSAVMKTFKDIKQSVVEVIRVVGVEVRLPAELSSEELSVEVTIQRPGRQLCRLCRRRKHDVYGSFVLPLNTGSDTRSGFPNYDCRVLALHRRYGKLQLTVELKGTARRSSRWKNGPTANVIARYTAPVPAMSSSPDMLVEIMAPEYVSHAWAARLSGGRSEDRPVRVTLRALQSKQVFDLSRCRPSYMKYIGHNEWRPVTGRQWSNVWKTPWRDDNLVNWSGLLATMTADMKSDAIILYQTMFAQSLKSPPQRPRLSKEEEEAHDLRVLFLKRLILCIAACKLTYCTEENGSFLRAWPFPLASALAHGNRILIRLDGVSWQAFINLLLFGDPKHHQWSGEDAVPSPFWARWAATHAIGLQPETSRLYERRLKTGSVVKNVKDGLLGHHLGMDLPLGGLGNRAPPSEKYGPMFVGPSGVPFRKLSANLDENPEYVEEVQNGHLYLRWDDFGVTTIPLLATDTGPVGSPSRAPKGRRRSRSYSAGRGLLLASPSASPGGLSSSSPGGYLEAPTPPAVTPSDKEPSTGGISSLYSGRSGASASSNVIPRPSARSSVLTNEEWMQLPFLRSLEDLQGVLKEHGYMEIARNQDGLLTRLYRLLVQDSELALQSNGEGRLRLRGVLIHLVLAHDIDAEDKVLVHLAAQGTVDPNEAFDRENSDPEEGLSPLEGKEGTSARGLKGAAMGMQGIAYGLGKDLKSGISKIGNAAGHAANQLGNVAGVAANQLGTAAGVAANQLGRAAHLDRFMPRINHDGGDDDQAPRTIRVQDPRVAVEVRRRHEPWTEAMRRLCQSQLQLGSGAVEKILKKCRNAMSGEAEEELCVYLADGPPSLCHHHHVFARSGIPVEYQAYRFTVTIQKKHRPMFQNLFQSAAEFETTENGLNLDGFGRGFDRARGSITRSWAWMSVTEAAFKGVAGLHPPEERLHIINETAPLSAVMIGIESSAPHKESFFSGKHGVSGSSKDVSAFGVRKWRDYRRGGQEVPADIGGLRVQIDQQAFEELVTLCKHSPLSRPSEGYLREASFERKLFRALLVASDEEAGSILREHLNFGRPSLQSQTGTMVLDSNVKERSVSSKSIGSEQHKRRRERENSQRTLGSQKAAALDDDSEDDAEPTRTPEADAGSRPTDESDPAPPMSESYIEVEPALPTSESSADVKLAPPLSESCPIDVEPGGIGGGTIPEEVRDVVSI